MQNFAVSVCTMVDDDMVQTGSAASAVT